MQHVNSYILLTRNKTIVYTAADDVTGPVLKLKCVQGTNVILFALYPSNDSVTVLNLIWVSVLCVQMQITRN